MNQEVHDDEVAENVTRCRIEFFEPAHAVEGYVRKPDVGDALLCKPVRVSDSRGIYRGDHVDVDWKRWRRCRVVHVERDRAGNVHYYECAVDGVPMRVPYAESALRWPERVLLTLPATVTALKRDDAGLLTAVMVREETEAASVWPWVRAVDVNGLALGEWLRPRRNTIEYGVFVLAFADAMAKHYEVFYAASVADWNKPPDSLVDSDVVRLVMAEADPALLPKEEA